MANTARMGLSPACQDSPRLAQMAPSGPFRGARLRVSARGARLVNGAAVRTRRELSQPPTRRRMQTIRQRVDPLAGFRVGSCRAVIDFRFKVKAGFSNKSRSVV